MPPLQEPLTYLRASAPAGFKWPLARDFSVRASVGHGSWVVLSGVISRVTMIITLLRDL